MGIGMCSAICLAVVLGSAMCQPPSRELRFCLRADPKTFDPLRADEEPSEIVRYLTGGVLIRFNRQTQRFEPELARSWTIRDRGRRIDFVLRQGVRFSDGRVFSSADVVATIRRVADPSLHSAVADAFRSGTTRVNAESTGPNTVSVSFTRAVVGLELLFDQLAISPAAGGAPEKSVLGPFVVAEQKSGQYVLLRRNPNYWRLDAHGQRLPYISGVRLEIQSNRDTEVLRFRRGELDLIDNIDAESFERLRREKPAMVVDAGPSLDSEILWFNQAPTDSVPAYKQRWFQSQRFRRAVSAAINREDLVRLTYRGYAHPAAGPVSPANRLWFNTALNPEKYNQKRSLELLAQEGFRFDGRTLYDRDNNRVEFSLLTNAGNRVRNQLGTMVQQDLARIGIRLNFTTVEFQSLIERITRTMAYEACLLGFTNIEVDPNTQINVWPSSGTLHAWNPKQTHPATEWEAEIDRLMNTQATEVSAIRRKAAFDRVQEIVAEQAPVVYLVHPDVLVAVGSRVHEARPSVIFPHLIWNIEQVFVDSGSERGNH